MRLLRLVSWRPVQWPFSSNSWRGNLQDNNRERQLEVYSAAVRALRHAICILALMWTGLVNGQPFFFASDTTNYIRAADAAVYVASHGRLSTAWTTRYRGQIDLNVGARNGGPDNFRATQISRRSSNDLRQGVIMGGRSPYIGALMYIGYVAGDFWPFVLLQAVIAYFLIILTLRRFGVTRAAEVTAITLGLAVTTSLPTYVSLLLADAFASFGILAFLLLATPGRLSRAEQAFLALVLVTSVTAHLTHIVMLIGMVAALALLAAFRLVPRPPRRAWIAGIAGVAVGLLSVQLTAEATQLAFGRKPQLLPLLTARFIADGPGKHFIESGCDGGRFEICHIRIGEPHSDADILFGDTPETGGYMLGDAEQRLEMGQQDISFALAVLKYDPAGELWAIGRNTVRQFFWIDYDGLNQDCFAERNCWDSLPTPVRAQLRETPSGKGLWPQSWMNALLYATVSSSLIVAGFLAPLIARRRPRQWLFLRQWIFICLAAMLVCSFFGGAVADPQYRYEGRLIWLVPLISSIALCQWRQILDSDAHSGNLAIRSHASGPLSLLSLSGARRLFDGIRVRSLRSADVAHSPIELAIRPGQEESNAA